MNVFISLPMHGRTDEQILKEISRLQELVRKKYPSDDISFIDTFHQNAPEREFKEKRLWYLGGSIQKMADADLVVMANGWRDANGCIVESLAAVEYGIRIVDERLIGGKN